MLPFYSALVTAEQIHEASFRFIYTRVAAPSIGIYDTGFRQPLRNFSCAGTLVVVSREKPICAQLNMRLSDHFVYDMFMVKTKLWLPKARYSQTVGSNKTICIINRHQLPSKTMPGTFANSDKCRLSINSPKMDLRQKKKQNIIITNNREDHPLELVPKTKFHKI